MHTTTRRLAFTLIELLIVMAIIALLASMLLVALWGAQEEARIARTQAIVKQLNVLVMTKWEAYQTRSVPAATVPFSPSSPSFSRSRARQRLDVMRELMRMELPDRIEDVVDGPHAANALLGFTRPSLSRGYARRVVGTWSDNFQGAECLYMIVSSMNDGDSDALSFFRESEIGDFDNDGMPEFLDGWGNPIIFVRWPIGLHLRPRFGATASEAHSLIPETPDALDLERADPLWVDGVATNQPYTVIPAIISAGPDGLYHFNTVLNVPANGTVLHYNATNRVPNDPYVLDVGSLPLDPNAPPQAVSVGAPFDSGFDDNIHSHLLGAR